MVQNNKYLICKIVAKYKIDFVCTKFVVESDREREEEEVYWTSFYKVTI